MAGLPYEEDEIGEEEDEDEILKEAQRLSSETGQVFGKIEEKYIINLVEATKKKKDLEAKLKIAKAEADSARQLMITQLRSANTKSVRTADGVLITLIKQSLFSTDAKNRVDYVMKQGRRDLLSVNIKTFGKFCNELVEKEFKLPDFISKFELYSLQVRGA